MPLEIVDRAHPSLIPENNLRLPDAITIVHGPRRLLARFILAGDGRPASSGCICGCGTISTNCCS